MKKAIFVAVLAMSALGTVFIPTKAHADAAWEQCIAYEYAVFRSELWGEGVLEAGYDATMCCEGLGVCPLMQQQ